MAARNRPGLSEQTRLRIQTTMLVERLTKHILGECDMSSTQVRAAQILLNKSLPDLQSIEVGMEGGLDLNVRQVNVSGIEPLDS